MDVGETGGPVQTEYGFHIVKLLDKGTRPMEEAARLRLQQQAFQTWFDEEMAQAEIAILLELDQ
jgi:parvulin-like peptidyl-prolyl isomerase